MSSSEKEKIKTYNIKVPVFTSERVEYKSDLFPITYDEMVKDITSKLDEYNKNPTQIVKDSKTKTVIRKIEDVEYLITKIGKIDGILLKINACNTNLYDGYVETDKQINLAQNDKIGSTNNFIMLYPVIKGIDPYNVVAHWLILVYEDPNKNAEELINSMKLVLKNILNLSIANIKLPDVLKKLEKEKITPEIQVRLTSLKYDDNDVDIKYQDYLVKSKIRHQKEQRFINMPFETIEQLINNNVEDGYQKRTISAIFGKNEYRITKELKDQKNEAQQKIYEAVEQIFNATTEITKKELEMLYNKGYILEKLVPVLNNYLNSNND